MIKTIVGNNIRQYRNALGLNQEKFANIVGLDRTYISSVEQGKRNISVENIKKIADALNVNPSNLFDNTFTIDNILININRENFLLQSITPLKLEEKDMIEFFCRALYDDYPECAEMSCYEKISFIKDKIKDLYSIVLLSTPISIELFINK